jgi:hypothetical protein
MEVTGIIRVLFWGWLALSGAFWALIGALYFIGYYFAHHQALSH